MKSFEEKAEELTNKANKLLSIIPIREYFKHIQEFQNSYIVEMRRLVGIKLREEGFTLSEIGQAVGRSHCTVLYNIDIEGALYVNDVVKANYEDWMEQGVYPVVFHVLEPNHLSKLGVKSVAKYKLQSIHKKK